MKRAIVDAKAFAEAMNKVSKVLKKSAIPILEEIAVRIQDDRCTLAATDMETWLVAELPVHGDDTLLAFRRCACPPEGIWGERSHGTDRCLQSVLFG